MLKILWFDFKKGIFFIIAAVVLLFAPKLLRLPYINNDINEVLMLCDGKTADETQEIIETYIDEQFAALLQSNLLDEEKATEMDRISAMHSVLSIGINDKRATEELIENAKIGSGISLDMPPQYYYDNLDEYKNISRTVNIVNESSWKSFMYLQQIQFASVMALCVIAAVWGRHSEHGLFRSERVSLRGKSLNKLRMALSLGFCIAVWLISYIVDIACCGVALMPDSAMQSIMELRYSPLALSIGEYLVLIGLLELMGLIFAFLLFYLLNSYMRDIKKTLTVSAFVILLSYVLKNGFGSVFSWLILGICDYGKFTDGSLYNTSELSVVITANIILIVLLILLGKIKSIFDR